MWWIGDVFAKFVVSREGDVFPKTKKRPPTIMKAYGDFSDMLFVHFSQKNFQNHKIDTKNHKIPKNRKNRSVGLG